ncbi:MAG: T9SS type A sorting domain-containing protein [Fidelibacterota bacterium]|nr:MAG: T9SS type A sorting domain-containing protein [Candidatus Neomarinimicrobiota bacterium]
MKRNILLQSLIVTISLGLTAALAQWEVFECDQLPQDADPPWIESNSSFPDDNETSVLSVIDDPDITGNKLIKIDTQVQGAGFKEQWKKEWGGDPAVGQTLVFRAAALDTSLFDRDLDVYIYNGYGGERLITKIMGTRVKFDRSGIETAIDVTKWHIYRVTAIADQFELYIDEDPLSYLTATGVSTTDKYFRFGDGGSSLHGALYDWFVWDTTGAYAPGYGTALPDSLTGLTPASIERVDQLYPENFGLSQNYPNPFNPTTEIQFKVSRTAPIRLKVYDLSGSLIHTLVNESKQPGTYSVKWNGRDIHGGLLPSGIYFYSMEAGNYRETRKMLLMK